MARRAKKSEEAVVEDLEEIKVDAPMEEHGQKASEEVYESVSRCGEVLRAEREAQGLSTKEVAKQLRLSNTQIQSLEINDFVALPESTIVKGFIRNYAKLLDIPADTLLADYVGMVPENSDYSFTLDPGINMKISDSDKPNIMRYILVALGLLLAFGVWFFYQNYVEKPSPDNLTPDIVESLPELALPIAERGESIVKTGVGAPQIESEGVVELDKELSNVAPEVDVATTTPEIASEEAVEEIDTTADTEVSDEPTITAQIDEPAPGKTRLKFSASQETWLSVVNTSGQEVYNKILYSGNSDVVDVRNPKEIVIGNAHGAILMIDGKSIDLAPYTRINVARVSISRLSR